MSITLERKAELIQTHGRTQGDTGSAEVQVAILSERIANLTEHFKSHKKDCKKDDKKVKKKKPDKLP